MVDHDVIRGGSATGGRLLTARGRRTRANLIAAAKRVFEAMPFDEARIADIAAEAGTASGTFYTYFDTKEAVFREVAAEVLTEMTAAARFGPVTTLSLGGDPARDVADALISYYRTCLRNAGVARSIELVATRDTEVARTRRATVVEGVKMVERWIRSLQDLGVCDPDLDPWVTAMVLHTMAVRVVYDHLLESGNEAEVETLVDTVIQIWSRTVGLEPTGRRTEPGPRRP